MVDPRFETDLLRCQSTGFTRDKQKSRPGGTTMQWFHLVGLLFNRPPPDGSCRSPSPPSFLAINDRTISTPKHKAIFGWGVTVSEWKLLDVAAERRRIAEMPLAWFLLNLYNHS
jgi:hypothetical protein